MSKRVADLLGMEGFSFYIKSSAALDGAARENRMKESSGYPCFIILNLSVVSLADMHSIASTLPIIILL